MSDSTPSDKAAQSRHAAAIGFRRQVSEQLGITTQQAKRLLARFDEQIREQQSRPAVRLAEIESNDPFPKGAKIEEESTHFQKTSIPNRTAGGGQEVAHGVSSGPDTEGYSAKEVIINDDGTLNRYNVLAEFIAPL